MRDYKSEIRVLEKKLGTLKTKKAIEKIFDKLNLLLREFRIHLMDMADQFGTKTLKGIVESYNKNRGTLRIDLGEWGIVYADNCNDILSKSWYNETCCIDYTDGQEVTVIVEAEAGTDSWYLSVKRIQGGTLNQNQYAELCDRGGLAFFKYPDGTMSGLFARS